ncbi:hypothetical protein BDZ89DRAFT_1144834 [Hymenopellis radicata]|nr:hypothetical protein BDZ89DRAFT_1144834 [Hymenopellis radicata]
MADPFAALHQAALGGIATRNIIESFKAMLPTRTIPCKEQSVPVGVDFVLFGAKTAWNTPSLVPTEWHDGGYFVRRDLRHFGFELQLGHVGGMCLSARAAVDLIVVDVNGMHDCRVRYCGCSGSEVSRVDQLMRTSLFPATTAQPRMAFTFRMLRTMKIDLL